MTRKNVSRFCLLFFFCALLVSCHKDEPVALHDPVEISFVSADDHFITVVHNGPPSGLYALELRSYEDLDPGAIDINRVYKLSSTGKIERFQENRDLIYSGFYLIDSENAIIDGPRYVSDTSAMSACSAPLLMHEGIKGLTCIVNIEDAVELGVKYATDNLNMRLLIDFSEQDCIYYEFEDITIPISRSHLAVYDKTFRQYYENDIAIAVVFLNVMASNQAAKDPLLHPNTDIDNAPTPIGAFNIIEPLGWKYYVGLLEFISERYTRQDAKYGQISMLIVGNELQQHWVWHNMGEVPKERVIDEYVKSVRLAWLASQKFHEDLKVFISMEHHWTATMTGNPLREVRGDHLLEGIVQQCRAEGDFPWNIAFHPYPENLFEPRFWRDRSPTFDFDTPRITFKNLEILPEFLRQERMLYNGRMRSIALTEQGFHMPDGPDGELIQAAAYVYSFIKVRELPEIIAYMLHRQVDHPGEGGLKLGLWHGKPLAQGQTSDGLQDWGQIHEEPTEKKFIWEVFKYADTPKWEEYVEFAKPILGIDNWGDVPTDTGPRLASAFTVAQEDIICNLVQEFDQTEGSNNLACQVRDVLRAAGWLSPAIFHHPPSIGTGKLIYTAVLPESQNDRTIKLIFETLLDADSPDGVKWAVSVNDQELLCGHQTSRTPETYNVDLSDYAGQTVKIRFDVHKNQNSNNDWFYWVNPLIIHE